MKAELINKPYSGEFKERIYDIESPWNSQDWTWIKFVNENGIEKVGQFRGFPKGVKVSKSRNEIIVLTSDYVFHLDSNKLDLIETENQPNYENLEVTTNGVFVFSEFSNIYKMDNSLSDMKVIKSPFEMDLIKFKSWNENVLEFECTELGNYERNENMELDTTDWTIRTKKTTPQHPV